MDIIDFHTHVYPQKIAKKATENTCNFYQLNSDRIGTTQELLSEGHKAGISRFVLLPVAVKPEQTHHINQFIIEETKAHPDFYGFGTVHAAMNDILEEVEFIKNSGLKGVKLHPDIQQMNIDDPILFPVYDYLQDKLPVLIHCGDPRYDYSHPRRLRRILDAFPCLQVVAAHLGGWSLFDTAVTYLKDTNCFFDLSSCFSFLTGGQMVKYISGYGAERVLFGTDFPLWSPKKEVEAFLKLDISFTDREKILSHNAMAILNEV